MSQGSDIEIARRAKLKPITDVAATIVSAAHPGVVDTVLVDGRRINSCLALAVSLDGAEITTIEGLADGAQLHPVQAAFINHDGFQCGFCTPGMMITARALLDRNPEPTEDEIREAISGQICRCTGYTTIVRSIQWAAAHANEEVQA